MQSRPKSINFESLMKELNAYKQSSEKIIIPLCIGGDETYTGDQLYALLNAANKIGLPFTFYLDSNDDIFFAKWSSQNSDFLKEIAKNHEVISDTRQSERWKMLKQAYVEFSNDPLRAEVLTGMLKKDIDARLRNHPERKAEDVKKHLEDTLVDLLYFHSEKEGRKNILMYPHQLSQIMFNALQNLKQFKVKEGDKEVQLIQGELERCKYEINLLEQMNKKQKVVPIQVSEEKNKPNELDMEKIMAYVLLDVLKAHGSDAMIRLALNIDSAVKKKPPVEEMKSIPLPVVSTPLPFSSSRDAMFSSGFQSRSPVHSSQRLASPTRQISPTRG